jgi:coenzyme PQQ precursor peptide PqqA
MPWTKPDFVEIPLGMEVTAYVNTDGPVVSRQPPVVSEEKPADPSLTTDN